MLLGVAGIALSRTWEGARTFLIGGGIVHLILFIYGLFAHSETGANWIPVNSADNVLHVALGAGMILLGLTLAPRATERDRPATS